jgi:Tol biopolymer transport system component
VHLQAGRSLLHFRLVEKIGEGGMGEVWRAVDTTLDREVAVKVIPAPFAGDRERLARFEREAKLLAALNHPSIAAVYGFPEATVGTETVRFLALELVRGEDLAEILASGPLTIRETLDAARQIAAALEAAHDSGVIHRDLKPANIKRTPQGQIKVLDFGLAKALETAGPYSGQTATVTSAGSQAGVILGTASYMSPEQARGLTVDRRTDLWAFGCVLFEMLSGAKAFDGPTVTDVLAAVVKGEPDWSKLPAGTPAPVRRLLRRCLEKDPQRRLRDAGDASLLLDENPEDLAPTSTSAGGLGRWLVAALTIAAALAGLSAGWWLWRGGDAGGQEAISFRRVTFARGQMRSARFAPDGRTIVFGAAWGGPPVKLYFARTDAADAAPIPIPPAELLSVSKSGEMAIAVGLNYYGWMGLGTLARTSLLGGTPREIMTNVRSADWSADGSQLAVVRSVDGIDQLEYPPGKVLLKSTGYFEQLRFSPDGTLIAFVDHPAWGDNLGHISVIDPSGKKTTLAADFPAVQGVAWAPGGKEVWFTAATGDQGSAVYAVDLSGRRRLVYMGLIPMELFDIAADGRVLLASHRPEREAQALLDGFTEPRPLVVPGESSVVRTISPDGRMTLVANQIPKTYETFLVRSDHPGAVRLTEGESLSISRDGAWALTSSADYTVFSVTPTGMGPTRAIPNPDGLAYASIATWLPDAKRIVMVARKGDEPSRGFVCDVATGVGKPFGAPGMYWPLFVGPPVSPDGRHVVLLDVSGTAQRWPVDGGDPLPIPGILPADQPLAWTEDGAALFVAARSLPITIVRLDLATGHRTTWKTLAPTDSAGLRFSIPMITPDGKHWTLSTAKLLSDLYIVEGLE